MQFSFKFWLNLGLVLLLLLLPGLTESVSGGFYTLIAIKVLIMALAAVGLNFLVGHSGLVAFGHAGFMGIGAYGAGICLYYYFENGHEWLASGTYQLLIILLATVLIALLVGAISLRTRGIYFIMITLAFSQLLYYLTVGMDTFGGDDGLSLYQRSEFSASLPGLSGTQLDLHNNVQLYFLSLSMLLLTLFFQYRWLNSPFGLLIQGAHSNENRMAALGYNIYPYQLITFIVSALVCAIAGFLLANANDFISPDILHWQHSGELLAIIILGGTRSVMGPVYGAIIFYSLEEGLSAISWQIGSTPIGEFWQLIFAPILILIVLLGNNGIYGALLQLPEKIKWLLSSSGGK